MGQDKVMEMFFENPSQEFYLRQIAKITKVPKTTVARILQKLLKDRLIIRKSEEPYDRYVANGENSLYKFYKKQFILERIHRSGLIEYIVNEAHPKAIILFGSCAKGEYDKNSDMDIFVQSIAASLDLERFKLGHKVNIFFEPELGKLSEELRNNIINGVKLYGVLRI